MDAALPRANSGCSLRNTAPDGLDRAISSWPTLAAVKSQREGERAIEIIEDGAASRYSSEADSRYRPASQPTMALAHRTSWFLA